MSSPRVSNDTHVASNRGSGLEHVAEFQHAQIAMEGHILEKSDLAKSHTSLGVWLIWVMVGKSGLLGA